MTTRGQYASALSLRAGFRVIAPKTPNLIGLVAVMTQEDTTCILNPMATTQRWPGSRACNTVGVQAYPNLDASLDAVLATLHNGLYNAVLDQLASGDCACTLARAWAESPWGTWHNYSPVARGIAAMNLVAKISANPAPYLNALIAA